MLRAAFRFPELSPFCRRAELRPSLAITGGPIGFSFDMFYPFIERFMFFDTI